MYRFLLLFVEDILLQILRLEAGKVGEAKAGQTAQNEKISRGREVRAIAEFEGIYLFDLVLGKIDCVGFLSWHFIVGQINNRDYPALNAVPYKFPELMDRLADRIDLQADSFAFLARKDIMMG